MHTPKHPHTKTATLIAILLILSPIFIATAQSAQITNSQEYKQFVHINNKTNTTALDKPIYPVMINTTQIAIGQNWTITCPLKADHKYQIYCYGAWTNTQTDTKTDYDIYVYDPTGKLVSTHTQAAGITEYINSQTSQGFFIPTQNGIYSFVVKNDARESQGSQQATFTITENLDCNQWYTAPIQGKNSDGVSSIETTWTYAFQTNASTVQVYLTIPNNLDMYEARLFLMNDGSGPTANGYPLAVESGLYGNITSLVGGYNFDTNGSRGVSYASCEHMGNDMFLNYNTTTAGTKLYYLTLIGEEGQGNVEFMFKTNFDTISLQPANTITKLTPGQTANVTYNTSGPRLEEANFTYSIDNWTTSEFLPMTINNQTCNAIVPGQKAGTNVQYQIDAVDMLENILSATGNYTVKNYPKLNITIAKNTVLLGQNITVNGVLAPYDTDSVVDILFMSANDAETVTCNVTANGNFTGSFGPQTAGDWSVIADSLETDTSWSSSSSQYLITVNEPPIFVKYSLYIVIGLVVACAVGGVVYFLKFRGK